MDRRCIPCETDTTGILLQRWVVKSSIVPSQMHAMRCGTVRNSLLHRESTRPRPISLDLVLILMVRLVLSVDLYFSIIKLVDSAHIRQEGRWVRGRDERRGKLKRR
jgi:hypothetical protein